MSRYANVAQVQGLEETSRDVVDRVVAVMLGPVGSSQLNATSRALQQSTDRIAAQIRRGRVEFIRIEQENDRRKSPEFDRYRTKATKEAQIFQQLVERAGHGAVYLMLGDDYLFPSDDDDGVGGSYFPGAGPPSRYFQITVQSWLRAMLAWKVDRWDDIPFLRKAKAICRFNSADYLRCVLQSPGGLARLENGTLPHTLYEDGRLPKGLQSAMIYVIGFIHLYDFYGRAVPSPLDFLERATPEWVSMLDRSPEGMQKLIQKWQAREEAELLDPSVDMEVDEVNSDHRRAGGRWESLHRPVPQAALQRAAVVVEDGDDDDDDDEPMQTSTLGRLNGYHSKQVARVSNKHKLW